MAIANGYDDIALSRLPDEAFEGEGRGREQSMGGSGVIGG
jgi:hypothetical protein